MGNAKRMCLSHHRLSRKKAYVKKRKEKRELMLQRSKEQVTHNTETNLINSKESVNNTKELVLSDMIKSETSVEITDCLYEIKKEEPIDNEKELEVDNGGGMYDQNIVYCEDNNDLEIINHDFLSTNIQENIPEGRYIIDMSYMWNEMRKVLDNHQIGTECHFKDWILIGSRRRGFLTEFTFKCQICRYETSIYSEPIRSQTSDINAAAVAAATTVGIGYSKLKRLCKTMNIFCMSDSTYRQRKNLIDNLEDTQENMKIKSGIKDC